MGPPDLVGNGGKFLGVNAGETAVVWGTPAASGTLISTFIETVLDDVDSAAARATLGVVARATSAKTAAFLVGAADDGTLFNCSAASADFAATLLSAVTAGDGFEIIIKKTDATKFMITITANGSETIDGLPNLKLRHLNSQATLVSDGSNWRIASHENVAIEYNAAENISFQVYQYGHVTRTGLPTADIVIIDRWRVEQQGNPSARYTMSIESDGGVDGKSKWMKILCTTADASPGASESEFLRQVITGNNSLQFFGTDGLVEGGVLSMDIIGHLNTPAAPYTGSLGWVTKDGTDRMIADSVTIDADATWQRVHIVIPEDSIADIDPGTGESNFITVGIYGGSSTTVGTAGTWENYTNGKHHVSGHTNFMSAVNDYIGITNVKFQPGRILTPFVPRTYEEEFDICEFYLQKFSSPTSSGVAFANSNNELTTRAVGFIALHRAMRASPTVQTTGTATDYRVRHNGGSATTASSAPSIYYGGEPWGTSVRFEVASGLTQDEASQLQSATTSAYIILNAEI